MRATAPLNEDWLAVVLGLAIFVLALAGSPMSISSAGWSPPRSGAVSARRSATSKDFSSLGGIGALIATYLALLFVLSAAAASA